MVRTWKVKGRGLYHGIRISSSAYFIKNNVVSCGWGIPEIEDRHLITRFEMYKEKWIEVYGKDLNWNNQGVHHLFESVKEGDYLWTRLEGDYYVARVPKDPKELFKYDLSEEALRHDSSVQLTNIVWKKVGAEDSVPGSISTFSSNRNSIVKVDNHESDQNGYTMTSLFSKRALDSKSVETIKDRNMIFGFIGPSGLEDIVALWLFDRFNYVVIPSTNKSSTQTYEFVLVDATKTNGSYQSSKRIYIQVKNGNNDLRLEDYVNLLNTDDEIWLISRLGKIYNLENEAEEKKIVSYKKASNQWIKNEYDLQELIDFVFDENKKLILPKSLLVWTSLFE